MSSRGVAETTLEIRTGITIQAQKRRPVGRGFN